jgi:predicted anti-sigma-YlaC factor YlaD
MSVESNVSGHWTEEQLIAHLYGIGPEDGHIDHCDVCRQTLASMQAHREMVELSSSPAEEVSLDLLAAQRREIYAKITEPTRWWSNLRLGRWAPAAVALIVLGGGVMVFEQNQRQAAPNGISDAQLAQDVSRMAEDPEPPPTAPLQALFEE